MTMGGTHNEKPAVGWTAGQGEATTGTVRRIYYNQRGRPVATLDGSILKKRVRGSVHMLRRPPAWAIDQAILEAARRDGARAIEVFDAETRKVYAADLQLFDLHGIRFNRGYGDQVALPLAHWRVESQDARQLSLMLEV